MDKISQIAKKLNSKLVFAKFGEITSHQTKLYADYNEIDEANEINNEWRNFSRIVMEHLLSVAQLTKSLLIRIIDEVERKGKKISNEDKESLENITSFWLDISLLSYLYSTLVKSGVLKQGGMGLKPIGYFDTRRNLDELTMISFKNPEYFSKKSIEILSSILEQEQYKSQLHILDESETIREQQASILGIYDQGQAEFILNALTKRVSLAAASWWWRDSIALHSAMEDGLFHLKSIEKIWKKTTSYFALDSMEYYTEKISIANLYSGIYLSNHFRLLGVQALIGGNPSAGASYFKESVEILLKEGKEKLQSVEFEENWSRFTVSEVYMINSSIERLATASLLISNLLKNWKVGISKLSEADISKSLQLVNDSLSQGEIQYISSVALLFETILSYIKMEFKRNQPKDIEITETFVKERIAGFLSRLSVAANSLVDRWTQILKKSPDQVEQLNFLIKDVELLELSVLIIPVPIKQTKALYAKLRSISLATEALSVRKQANDDFGKNPVKELMMRAKSFHLANQAIEICSEKGLEEVKETMNSILSPIGLNALLRGLIAEIQLKIALLQYQFVNKLAILIEKSTLSKAYPIANTENDLNQLTLFQGEVEEIKIAAETINKYKAPISIKGSNVNWEYFSILTSYMKGLIDLLEITKHAIIASQSPKVINLSKSIENWDKAQNLSYKAAEVIGKAGGEESPKLGESLFKIGQMFGHAEQQARDKKDTGSFPVELLLEILQKIIMGSY